MSLAILLTERKGTHHKAERAANSCDDLNRKLSLTKTRISFVALLAGAFKMFECLDNGPAMLGFLGSLLIVFTLGLSIGINSEKRFKRRTERDSSNHFQRQFIEQEE